MVLGKAARLVAISLIALPLAMVASAQALSSVATRSNSALAAKVFPANGSAFARLSLANYASSVVDPASPTPPNAQDVELARKALQQSPLSPKAHVVLAQAEQNSERQHILIAAASKLNRRDLALQGLVLQRGLADQNYAATIQALDQILRVHPKRSKEFFPVLVAALEQDATIPIFAKMLDGRAPWHEGFLNFAVRSPGAVPNLARLRTDVAIGDETFDKQLIAALFKRGEVDVAGDIYERIAPAESAMSDAGTLNWRANYPPFDWAFADKAEFRAQPSRNGENLEIYVKPGQGGIIASRIFAAPKEPFTLIIRHSIEPVAQIDDVQVQAKCVGSDQFLVQQKLKAGVNSVKSSAPLPECHYVSLSLDARAWTGEAPLTGSIDSIEVRGGTH